MSALPVTVVTPCSEHSSGSSRVIISNYLCVGHSLMEACDPEFHMGNESFLGNNLEKGLSVYCLLNIQRNI